MIHQKWLKIINNKELLVGKNFNSSTKNRKEKKVFLIIPKEIENVSSVIHKNYYRK